MSYVNRVLSRFNLIKQGEVFNYANFKKASLLEEFKQTHSTSYWLQREFQLLIVGGTGFVAGQMIGRRSVVGYKTPQVPEHLKALENEGKGGHH